MTQFVIYKIYWPGKAFYIGKTRGFRKRRNRHLREIKDCTHDNKNLIRCGLLWGDPKIKIIAYADSDEHLHLLEKQFISMYKDNPRFKNINKGQSIKIAS